MKPNADEGTCQPAQASFAARAAKPFAHPFARLAFASIIAVALLWLYDQRKIQADQFALEAGSYSMVDSWHGRQITEWRMAEVDGFIGRIVKEAGTSPSGSGKKVLVLGFSQLHVINQYKEGDHLMPYWLMETANCDGCLRPLAISLPNANFQEYFLLAANILSRAPPRTFSAIVLNLPFDKLRNDGLRDELASLVTPEARELMSRSEIGRTMMKEWDARPIAGSKDESAGLHGFVQQSLEDRLNAGLGNALGLWSRRAELRSAVLVDLYFIRNFVLGIKPSSTRKMVRPRYLRNMQALEAAMTMLTAAGVPVLAYVAPVRSDVPPPYETAEYEEWKKDLARLFQMRDATLLDLDSVVPGKHWGRTNGDWVDYMHFQGEGHKIVATALLTQVLRIASHQGR